MPGGNSEYEREPVVGNGGHVAFFLGEVLEAGQELGLLPEDLVPPDPIDRAVARRCDDPRAGLARSTVSRPALDGGRECVLHRVLGELEVTEDAGEDGDRMPPLLSEDLLDRHAR